MIPILTVTILFTYTNASMSAAHMDLHKTNINRQYTIT